MEPIRLTRELRDQGLTYGEIRRLSVAGDLRRLRRGAYANPALETLRTPDPRASHLELLRATLRQSAPETVASHLSAAAVHGLPLWTAVLGRAQLTRNRPGGLKRRRYSEIRGIPLGADEVVVVDGMAVTSLARTVFDLGCRLPMRQAVPVGDAALRKGMSLDDAEAALERGRRRHGVDRARRSLRFLDHRAESPGESVSRVVLFEIGIPKPELQVEIRTRSGRLLGRCDFGWEELGTVGEFDGRVKYGRLGDGRAVEDVVWDEKRREDAIRSQGLQMVRWVTADLYPPLELERNLRQAFARGRPRR